MIYAIVIFIFLALLSATYYVIFFEFKKPFFIPFFVFRYFCSFGQKQNISTMANEVDGLADFQFAHNNYRLWFEDTVKKGIITRQEYFCFTKQRVIEIDAELKRRKNVY